ncbi:MAG: cyclase family protein [Crocinitomicaceae bacterium]|nr:cyclase family protein [Crocinitomicaceae bacterium]MDG1735162.1 cyclase family protein [Crocinitomicaceae bacterium]
MILHLNETDFINTGKPIDLSIELRAEEDSLKAWGQGSPIIAPVRDGNFIGSVAEGGVVNFKNISFNPHAHITHTECCGHITEAFHSINDGLKQFFFNAQLISFVPDQQNEDEVITLEQLKSVHLNKDVEALIIRTIPNSDQKITRAYTGTNPPYLDAKIATYLIAHGIEHVLVDLPSVDREQDNGALAFHHAFWEVPKATNMKRTITEFIYVPNNILDGLFILELQMSSFRNDACPSRPVLYSIERN